MHWRYVIAISAVVIPASAASNPALLQPNRERVSMSAPFVAAMNRTRIAWQVRGGKPLGQPIERDGSLPSRLPFYWESETGSSIQRMQDGSFRLEDWSGTVGLARAIACFPAGWPNYDCSDGLPRAMSAPDLNTLNFGGQTFRRLLPSSDMALDDPFSPLAE
jgi:hypothetical protein